MVGRDEFAAVVAFVRVNKDRDCAVASRRVPRVDDRPPAATAAATSLTVTGDCCPPGGDVCPLRENHHPGRLPIGVNIGRLLGSSPSNIFAARLVRLRSPLSIMVS